MNFVDLKRQLYSEEFERQIMQQRMYDYYIGDEDQILSYLDWQLKKTFDPAQIGEYQLNYLNITQKIVNSLAIVYKEPATRFLVHPTKANDSPEVLEVNKYYEHIQPINLNTKDKDANRLGRLWGKSLTQLFFDKREKRFKYQVLLNHQLFIKPYDDDPFRAEIVMYEKIVKGEKVTIVWTETEHFMIDSKDVIKPIGDNEEKLNPFGVLPFAELPLKETENYWGQGIRDVINANEQLNVLLTFFKNVSVFLGTQGTILAVNCDISKKGEVDLDGKRKVRLGVSHGIIVDDVRNDMKDPRLEHVSFDPHIVEIRDQIDLEVKRIAGLYGLNPNNVISQIKDTSDYQKMMDAVEQTEVRRDDIEPCRVYEKNRFETLRIMNNIMAGTMEGKSFGLKVIPEEYELDVDFAEIGIMKTPEDKQKEREFDAKYNLSSPIDWLIEDNPDLTDEEAEEKILENKDRNRNLLNKEKTLNDLFKQKEVANAGTQ